MAQYGNRGNYRGGKSGAKKQNTGVRLTGLFATKRRGLYTGSINVGSEQLDGLIKKIKEAKAANKGLSFFLWKSKFEDGPAYSLNVDVQQEYVKQPKRARIEEDEGLDEDGNEPEEEEDDLFGDD